jgi:2'-5' RNA ligase
VAEEASSAGRIFVAAPLDQDVRRAIGLHLAEALGDRALPGKVVPPGNWHITLRFLGATSVRQLESVRRNLESADLGPAFPLAFTSLGAFPSAKRARVLWLGTGLGASELSALAGHAERAAVAAGFEPEQRPFAAHLTLARLKPEGDVRALLDQVPPFDAVTTVGEVVMFRSRLGPKGPTYEPVAEIPLGGAASSHPGSPTP